jgi:predicted transcriptional regulator
MSRTDHTDPQMTPTGAARPAATLAEIAVLLSCEGPDPDVSDVEVDAVVASDAMSEILASSHHGALMITGLTNVQSVRTAVVADAKAIVYIRGKRPVEATLDLAREKGIPVLFTTLGMFECCGILHRAGMRGEI